MRRDGTAARASPATTGPAGPHLPPRAEAGHPDLLAGAISQVDTFDYKPD